MNGLRSIEPDHIFISNNLTTNECIFDTLSANMPKTLLEDEFLSLLVKDVAIYYSQVYPLSQVT